MQATVYANQSLLLQTICQFIRLKYVAIKMREQGFTINLVSSFAKFPVTFRMSMMQTSG